MCACAQVFIQHIVYEKEKNTRTMMRMHGLSDGPYWLISYAYFFVFSAAFIALFVVFGSLIGKLPPIIRLLTMTLRPYVAPD